MVEAVISIPLVLILLGWGVVGFINEFTDNSGDKFDEVQTA